MLPLVIGVIIVVGLAAVVILKPTGVDIEPVQLKKFVSLAELENYVKTAYHGSSGYYGTFGGIERDMNTGVIPTAMPLAQDAAESASGSAKGSDDFSQTNIQVEGVDEPDIVKTDGKYVYYVTHNKVFIVDAYPNPASIISEIDIEGTIQNIFINGDKLVVFGQDSQYYDPYGGGLVRDEMIMPPPGGSYTQNMFVKIYDITDKSNPDAVRELEAEGYYYDSRMIGDYAYIVINSPVQINDIRIPVLYEDGKALSTPGAFPDIYYFDNPDYSYRFTTVMSVNIHNDNEDPNSKIFMMSSANNMYVSQDNIYITYMKYTSPTFYYNKMIDEVILPITPMEVDNEISEIRQGSGSEAENYNEVSEVLQDYFNRLSETEKEQVMKTVQEKMVEVQKEIEKEREKTVIQKIYVHNGEIEYKAQGLVPGNILNQFSMDQFNNNFRIATTTGQIWGGTSANNVYVLDADLNIVGELEDLAPGERIYSVRFMGEKGYVVTFRKIDPLFVIDLSDPNNPTVLGKLKIPGYSDYLHPYDENHIIGIGKDTIEAAEELTEQRGIDFVWYQGVKIAIFDVTDVENPIELHKVVIGDRGTSSPALYDHKSFLFSKEKNLMVLPILLAEISEEQKQQDYDSSFPAYGEFVYQGAYIYEITLDGGFNLRGRITHFENDEEFVKSGYRFHGSDSVSRSLYIDEILYTFSPNKMKANNLGDLTEINLLEFS